MPNNYVRPSTYRSSQFYSKARKYVDISGGSNPTSLLARFVTSPIRDVQVILDFTIIDSKTLNFFREWQFRPTPAGEVCNLAHSV